MIDIMAIAQNAWALYKQGYDLREASFAASQQAGVPEEDIVDVAWRASRLVINPPKVLWKKSARRRKGLRPVLPSWVDIKARQAGGHLED